MSDESNVRKWLSKHKRLGSSAEGRKRRRRRNLQWQRVPHLMASNRKCSATNGGAVNRRLDEAVVAGRAKSSTAWKVGNVSERVKVIFVQSCCYLIGLTYAKRTLIAAQNMTWKLWAKWLPFSTKVSTCSHHSYFRCLKIVKQLGSIPEGNALHWGTQTRRYDIKLRNAPHMARREKTRLAPAMQLCGAAEAEFGEITRRRRQPRASTYASPRNEHLLLVGCRRTPANVQPSARFA